MIGASLQAAQSATKTRYFTAPDGTRYKWTKQTEPTQADIDAIVNYHTQTVAPAKKAVKEGGKVVADTLTGMFGTPKEKSGGVVRVGGSVREEYKGFGSDFSRNPDRPMAGIDAVIAAAQGNPIPSVKGILKGQELANKAATDTVAPLLGPIGEFIGLASGVPGAGKVGREMLPSAAGAAIGGDVMADVAVLGHPKATMEQRLRAAGNIAIQTGVAEAALLKVAGKGVKAVKSVLSGTKKASTLEKVAFVPREIPNYDSGTTPNIKENLKPIAAGDGSATAITRQDAEDFLQRAESSGPSTINKANLKTLTRGGIIPPTAENGIRLPKHGEWQAISGDFPENKSYSGMTESSALKKFFSEFGEKNVARSEGNSFDGKTLHFTDGTTANISRRYVSSKSGGKGADPGGHYEVTVSVPMETSGNFRQSATWRRGGQMLWEPEGYAPKQFNTPPPTSGAQVKPVTLFHQVGIGETYRDGSSVFKKVSKSESEIIESDIKRRIGTRVRTSPQTRVYPLTDVPQYNPKRVPTEPKPVSEPSVTAPKATKEPWHVDQKLVSTSPDGRLKTEVSYRGPGSPGKSVVFDTKSGMQFEIPNERLAKITEATSENSGSTKVSSVKNSGSNPKKIAQIERWQMTREEVNTARNMHDAETFAPYDREVLNYQNRRTIGYEGSVPSVQGANGRQYLPDEWQYYHGKDIEQALKEGKPVPAEVLADYPDLAAKYKQPTPNTPKPVEAPQKPVQAPETASVEATGIANQVLDREAAQGLINEVEKGTGKNAEHWQKEGQKAVQAGQDPVALARRIASGEEDPTPLKFGILQEGKAMLQRRLNNAAPGEEFDKALKEMDDYLADVQSGKGVWSDMGRALQAGTELDTGNFAQVIERVQKQGGKLNPKMEQQLRDMTGKVQAAEAKLAETERLLKEEQAKRTTASQAKKSPRFSKEELDAELDSLLKEFGQKTAKLSAGIDPELLPIMGKIAVNYMKRGVNTLDEVVAAVQSHFKDATYEDVMDGIDAATKDMPRTKSQIQSEMAKMKRAAKSDVAARKQIAEWQHQLDTGNYEVPTKRERVISKRLEDLRAEREILHREVLGRIKDAATPLGTKVLREGSALVRGAVLGSDMGQLTRQGLFAWSRPKNAIKGIVNASKAIVSEKNLVKIERDMQMARINGDLAQPIRNKAGLQLTHSISNPEEIVVGRLLQKIPVLGHLAGKPLERAQLAFINTVRTEMFDYGIKHGFTPAELKLRAQFINSVTGRSNVKSVPDLLAAVMTSPRYEISRWETLAAPLKNVGALGKDLVTGKGLNKAALANIQDMAVTAGGIYGMFKMSELAGYSVNFDPKSGDFLKMRRGNEVWDISAGLAPRLRDILRAYVYTTDPSYNKNLGDVIRGSVTRTISPSVRVPTNIASTEYQKANGRTVGGKGDKAVIDPISGFPIGEFDEGFQTFLPLIIQSMRQALKDEGPGAAASAGVREFIGGGVNRYPEKKPKP